MLDIAPQSTSKEPTMRTQTRILTAVGLVAAGAVAVAVTAIDDPDRSVDAIELGGFAVAAAPDTIAPDTSVSAARPVEGLDPLVGELRRGDDLDDWSVAGVDVDFGPDGWLPTAPSLGDFDGDGTDEPVLDELDGLENSEVTLGVRYEADEDGDRDDADVFTINGVTYRDPAGDRAPWETTNDQPTADRETVAAAAVAAVGEGGRAIEVERDNEDGWRGWDVEVRGADGREYQVLLDLSGTVVDVRLDD
jgi:hypothetical protein